MKMIVGESVLKIFSSFDATTLIPIGLFVVSFVFIFLFIVLYAKSTKTEKAIKDHKKSHKKLIGEVDKDNKKTDICYKEYFSEQNIFIEWNKRYFFIIILFFLGIILFTVGFVLILIHRSFFSDFTNMELSSFLIGVCTLISTIMIAILQFVNQKNLRLLENSRQGNIRLLTKKEKQENEIFNCFNSLNSFRVYNFSNPDNSFLIEKICKEMFGETDIAYGEVSFLIAIPLNKNLSFLNFNVEKVMIDGLSFGKIPAYSTNLSYKLADNFIFIFYNISHVLDNPIFYCINNYKNKPKFKVSMEINSTKTDLKAIVTMDASILSLVDKQYSNIDGIYCAEIYNTEYQFN